MITSPFARTHRRFARNAGRPLIQAASFVVDQLESRMLLTSVSAIDFDVDAPHRDLVVTFSGPIAPGSLLASDLIVRKVGSDGRIAAADYTVTLNAANTQARFAYSGVYADGDYTAQLLNDDVLDAASAPLAADTVADFFFKSADSTGPLGVRDRKSNGRDLTVIGAHFGLTPATFSQGDYDGDGSVTVDDIDYVDNSELPQPTTGVTGLSVSANDSGGVDLSWSHGSTVSTGFKVQRSADRGRTYTTLGGTLTANSFGYVDAAVSLTGVGSYLYRVRSVEPSNPLTNVPTISRYVESELRYGELGVTLQPVQAPTDLRVTSVGKNQITLAWTDASTAGTSFEVWRSTGGAAFTPVVQLAYANLTGWTDTHLKANRQYAYRVKTLGATTSSPLGNTATGTTTGGAPSVIGAGSRWRALRGLPHRRSSPSSTNRFSPTCRRSTART